MQRLASPIQLGIALVSIGCALTLVGSATAKADETPGLKIGEQAPDFSLEDQNGGEKTLAALLKKGNVALVFYRSADW
jgi:cytochrome oxidase Cu insertion factor (SCO1/SenC/PrrC family)